MLSVEMSSAAFTFPVKRATLHNRMKKMRMDLNWLFTSQLLFGVSANILVTGFEDLLGNFFSVIVNYFYLEFVTLCFGGNNAFVGVDQYRILTNFVGLAISIAVIVSREHDINVERIEHGSHFLNTVVGTMPIAWVGTDRHMANHNSEFG